jgi:hypothetical protein
MEAEGVGRSGGGAGWLALKMRIFIGDLAGGANAGGGGCGEWRAGTRPSDSYVGGLSVIVTKESRVVEFEERYYRDSLGEYQDSDVDGQSPGWGWTEEEEGGGWWGKKLEI